MKQIICLCLSLMLFAGRSNSQPSVTNAYDWENGEFDIRQIATNADLIFVGRVIKGQGGIINIRSESGAGLSPLGVIKGVGTNNQEWASFVFGCLEEGHYYLIAKKKGVRLDRYMEIAEYDWDAIKKQAKTIQPDDVIGELVGRRTADLSSQIEHLTQERDELESARLKYLKEKHPPLKSETRK